MTTTIRTEQSIKTLESLTRKFGDLFLHLSGEGKVSFHGLKGASWNGFLVTRFDGDLGCMEPLEPPTLCAYENALKLMRSLHIVPSLNLGENQQYTLTSEQWLDELDKFVNAIESNPFQKEYSHAIYVTLDDGTVVNVINILLKPICNTFVIGEFTASNEGEYLGEITKVLSKDGFETLMFSNDRFHFKLETTEGTFDYNDENFLRYRQHIPHSGDFLVKDPKTNKLIVLPRCDYTGYFH